MYAAARNLPRRSGETSEGAATIRHGPKSAPGKKRAVTECRARGTSYRASLRFLRVATREAAEEAGTTSVKVRGDEKRRQKEKDRRERERGRARTGEKAVVGTRRDVERNNDSVPAFTGYIQAVSVGRARN